jgi:hypothetical protein
MKKTDKNENKITHLWGPRPVYPVRLRVLGAWAFRCDVEKVVVVVRRVGVREEVVAAVVGDEARTIERARRPVRFVLAGFLWASWVAARGRGGG